MILQEQEKSLNQLKVLQDYAQFLTSRGLKTEAIKTYQKILDEFIAYPLQLKQVKKKIRQVI